jgi:HAD superfamily hydrolase (TIGR01509 family)
MEKKAKPAISNFFAGSKKQRIAEEYRTIRQKKKFGVVFDMDGVIFDSEACAVKCWKKVAENHGLHDIEKTLALCTGTTPEYSKKIFCSVYGQSLPYDELRKESMVYYLSSYSNGRLPLKKGALEILKFLKFNEIPTALATSTSRNLVMEELSDANLTDYFDVIVRGDMVKESKPHPQIYETACRLLNLPAYDCFAVEDSINGIISSYLAKMRPIMVIDLIQPTEEIYEKAEKIFIDLIQTKNYIRDNM